MSDAVASPIHRAKALVGSVMAFASDWVDRSAERIVRDVVGLRPSEDAVGGPSPRTEQEPASRFADEEEVSWLESGRTQLPYRRDSLWAVPQMWWEMALGGAGAATYAVSSVTRNPLGMAAGWALAAGGKGVLLLADLGRPERFPKVFAKPGTSWIARGSWAFAAFAGAGAVSLLPGLPRGLRVGAEAVADAASAVLMTYDGLFLNDSTSVASWRPRTLPALFAANAVQTGTAVASALSPRPPAWLRPAGLAASAVVGGTATAYVRGLAKGPTAARLSARDLVEADQRDRFLVTGGLLGTVLPAVVAACGSRSATARAVSGAAAAIGVEAIRRAVLQAGVHAPVIDPPRVTSQHH